MSGKSFWYYRELKIDCWTSHIYYAKKIINTFVCGEVRILVEKWNVCEGHIFPRPLLQTCRLETTSLWLNTRLFVNKNFSNSHCFIEINVNFCLLWAHRILTSIILHIRGLTVNTKSVMHLVFMFQLILFFAFWGAEKHVYHIVPFRSTRYVLKSFRCSEVSNRVRIWNKIKNNIYVRTKLLLCQLEILICINNEHVRFH